MEKAWVQNFSEIHAKSYRHGPQVRVPGEGEYYTCLAFSGEVVLVQPPRGLTIATVIKFICPSCRQTVKVKTELARQKVNCACGQKILVPEIPTAYDDPESALHPKSARSIDDNLNQIF
jgi:DNA-directed RNA polymerase subunit RPC12/RpoP